MLARRLDAAFFTTMPVSAERRRELRRAKAPAFPRPKGRAPDGCTWNKQAGGEGVGGDDLGERGDGGAASDGWHAQ